jgi:hypothetical protein
MEQPHIRIKIHWVLKGERSNNTRVSLMLAFKTQTKASCPLVSEVIKPIPRNKGY